MNESQSPEIEYKEEAESDFVEDHVDLVRVNTGDSDNGGDLGEKTVKKTEKKKAFIFGAFYHYLLSINCTKAMREVPFLTEFLSNVFSSHH